MPFLTICTQIFIISAVYTLGRLNFSVGWIIPLIFSTIRDYTLRKREIQQAVKDARRSMREVDNITSRFASYEEVPSWVKFPDVERAEWINVIVRLYWTKINGMVNQVLRDLQAKISKSAFFTRFMFDKIDLGDKVRSS